MSNHNTATIRTTVNAIVIFAVAWGASKITGRELDTSNPVIIVVGGVVFGILYRLSTVISEKIPYAGYVLFGVNRSPAYTDPPPAVPALADDPPPAA